MYQEKYTHVVSKTKDKMFTGSVMRVYPTHTKKTTYNIYNHNNKHSHTLTYIESVFHFAFLCPQRTLITIHEKGWGRHRSFFRFPFAYPYYILTHLHIEIFMRECKHRVKLYIIHIEIYTYKKFCVYLKNKLFLWLGYG